MKRKLISILLVGVVFSLVFGLLPQKAFADTAAVQNVQNLIANLHVQSLNNRESVVFARRSYAKLSAADRNTVTNLADLQAAEAWVLKYWIEDTYTGDPARPIDEAKSLGIGVLNGWYYGDPDYSLLPMNATQQAIIGDQDKALLDEMTEYTDNVYSNYYKNVVYPAGIAVERQINNMDPSNPAEVMAVRAAYNALTPMQKTVVTNLQVLKKAEGINNVIPANIISAGGRAPTNGNNYTIAQWQTIDDTMVSNFPNASACNIWIAGMLSTGSALPQGGINIGVNFNDIKNEDGKYAPPGYTPLTLAEWNAKNITFSQSGSAKATHLQFLDYFDQHNISVWLQVEPGFADMKTLMDIYRDVFHIKDHPCVKGFAVDVEWYYGVDEDMGIPVTDQRAQEWNEYLHETWGLGHDSLLLKHYDSLRLPTTYRGGENGTQKIVFCDDSQGFGALGGEASGVYDDPAAGPGDVRGVLSQFKLFADYYPDNEIAYQVGYSVDRQWFYQLEDPIIRSLGVKLSENSSNPTAIVWVQDTYSDSLTFPLLQGNQVTVVNAVLNYLSTTGTNNVIGQRFAGTRGTPPTLADAMYVKRMRDLVNALTPSQQSQLTSSRVTRLVQLEPAAVDIRIQDLIDARPDPGALHDFDYDKIKGIWDTYNALTTAQKENVTKYTGFTPYIGFFLDPFNEAFNDLKAKVASGKYTAETVTAAQNVIDNVNAAVADGTYTGSLSQLRQLTSDITNAAGMLILKPIVTGFNPVSVITAAGTEPVLPTVVLAVYSDNSTVQFPVTWEAISPLKYAQAGTFTVNGTVEGITIPVVANVTVSNTAVAMLGGPDAVGEKDQSFVLSYGLAGVQGISAQDVTISYDPNLFVYVSAVSALNNTTVQDQSTTPGAIRLIIATTGVENAVHGTVPDIVNITFKPVAPGTGSMSITNASLGTSEGNLIYADVGSKTIIVEADKSVLAMSITTAQGCYDSAVEGISVGQYPGGTKDRILKPAIDRAVTVKGNLTATPPQVAQSVADLNATLSKFQGLVITEHTGDINKIPGYDIGDLALIASNYNVGEGDSRWDAIKYADINADGKIELYELAFIARKILNY